MQIIFFIIVIFLIGFKFWNAFKAVESSFDHGSWSNDAVPDLNAQIIDVQSHEVQYMKNGAKFETSVIFSDGYKFTTCKTKREQHLLSYTITVDSELLQEIVENAIQSHQKAVHKKQKMQ